MNQEQEDSKHVEIAKMRRSGREVKGQRRTRLGPRKDRPSTLIKPKDPDAAASTSSMSSTTAVSDLVRPVEAGWAWSSRSVSAKRSYSRRPIHTRLAPNRASTRCRTRPPICNLSAICHDPRSLRTIARRFEIPCHQRRSPPGETRPPIGPVPFPLKMSGLGTRAADFDPLRFWLSRYRTITGPTFHHILVQ